MPLLQQVWEDYQAEGFLVIGLSVDRGPVGDFVRRLEDLGVAFPLAMAPGEATRGLGYGGTLPTTVLIDRDGNVAEHTIGVVQEGPLRQRIERLLAQPHGSVAPPVPDR
jgi:peroxiredoxin